MKLHSLRFVIGSALLMLSLFCPLLWNFIPKHIEWCFPFFDELSRQFILTPEKYRCYPIQTIAPFYFPFVLMPIYLLCKGLIPDMVVSIGNHKINLWSFHLTYLWIQAIDLFLSFSQMPYFRPAFVITGILLQVKWLMND